MAAILCQYVEVCVFRFGEPGPEYLLLQRSPHERVYPNIWQFVTGKIKEGELAHEAALRELREETSLSPTHLWVVPHTGSFFDPRTDVMNMVPLFAVQVGPVDQPVLSAEHSSFRWLPANAAGARLVWPSQRTGLDIVNRFVIGEEKAGSLSVIELDV